LMGCYPALRQIEANQLALQMQGADADNVEADLREITELAARSEVAAPSAVEALETGREDVDELAEKIELAASDSIRAGYFVKKGELIAKRLLNTRNFVGETLRRAGSKVAEVTRESLAETEKAIPRGVGKGVEEVVSGGIKAGAALLVASMIDPLTGLAVFVGSLSPFAKRAKDIAERVDELAGDSEKSDETLDV
ncbi:MAG: hypothetical protein JJE42_17830, partial [Burkholderiales bacterium]|nr:hypothetical protein [Burkholderiales bacterium]